MKTYEKLLYCRDQLRQKTDFVPRVALVLGSGLGGYAAQIEVEAAVPYAELEGFPVSTVPGHAGRFVLIHTAGTRSFSSRRGKAAGTREL